MGRENRSNSSIVLHAIATHDRGLNVDGKQGVISRVVHPISCYLPPLEYLIERRLRKTDAPMREPGKLTLVDSGYEQAVFVYTGKDGDIDTTKRPLACKINFRSAGLPQDELLNLANTQKTTHNRLRSLYREVPEFIPFQDTIIAHSHILGRPAVVNIQELVCGNLLDIFNPKGEDDRLRKVLKEDLELQEKYIKAAEITFRHFEKTGEIIDIGDGNVVVEQKKDGSNRLVLIDNGIVFSSELLDIRAKTRLKFERRVARWHKTALEIKQKLT